MHRCKLEVPGLVYPDSSCFDVFLEKIKYAENSKFLEGFRKPCLEPEPGRKVGVASFRIQDGLHLKPAGVFQDTFHLHFHTFVVS
jgi:hypothetical protein